MSVIPPEQDPNDPNFVPTTLEEQVRAMGKYEPAFGPNFKDTASYIEGELADNTRPDNPPPALDTWQCRIGGSTFFVPPVNIDVSQSFSSGSMSGGALRQMSSPKFNSGHSETAITMTIYFPTAGNIWGFEGDSITIDFDSLDTTDETIDTYTSSLRGLITQFRYTPFVPVTNAYLNGVHGITAVALESMTVSTVEDFPFVLQVQLNMLRFNHKVFLPMIEDFADAIHWGRFRQYMGRAAMKMEEIASKNFLTQDGAQPGNPAPPTPPNDPNFLGPTPPQNFRSHGEDPNTVNPSLGFFDKQTALLEGLNLELFYPDADPARQFLPDLADWRSPADETPQSNDSWYTAITKYIGFDIAANPLASYTNIIRYPGARYLGNEYLLLVNWLKTNSLIYTSMGQGQFEAYLNQRTKGLDPQTAHGIREEAQVAWGKLIYDSFIENPAIANVLAYQQFLRGQIIIQEWEVPMRKLGLDTSNVVVTGVNVSLGNNIVPLQLNMHGEPTYQHIGGKDTTCEITMVVTGEEEITRLRRMFEVISSISMLEHAHAVLGFLGIKNVVATICGMKYAIPQNFQITMRQGFPHVYDVTLTLLDFDVFQQKREMLSSSQQQELVDAFSKANPFLRIKQLWGSFNAYPDFPLAIRDAHGDITGHLDPDFYFKRFITVEDDIINWRHRQIDPKLEETLHMHGEVDDNKLASQPKSARDYMIIHHFGTITEEGTVTSPSAGIGLHAGGFDYLENNKPVLVNNTHNEATCANVQTEPFAPGCQPASRHYQPYFDKNGNPTTVGDPSATYDLMARDAQYRDISGRMIRAFPTYMLWLIDENGKFAGIKLFDNFYGLQSVIDLSIVRSEDIMADTLVIRMSNLYSRLSTPYRDLIDQRLFPEAANIINPLLNRLRNSEAGFSNYLVNLDSITLAPGARLHLRLGYSANPNALENVFNGVVTSVEQGDIITITAQSDAIELSGIINNTNTTGSSGRLDGSLMSGLWMSEPRDLMVRLLSMGTNTFKEAIAHAAKGMIFSENRYGIRHFGTILYEPLGGSNSREVKNDSSRAAAMDKQASSFPSDFSNVEGNPGGPQNGVGGGILDASAKDILQKMWTNFNRRRDYEVFKRNIYPGNGTGMAQYMGGDIGDGGMSTFFYPTGLDPNGVSGPNEVTGTPTTLENNRTNGQIEQSSAGHRETESHPILKILGITNSVGDNDILDEVSFRAQTYMKSVWDLFLLCGALLPNYIVAVRPFEDRSTVFYGKPHWAYTSGVIPITKGVKYDPSKLLQPDEEMKKLQAKLQDLKKKEEAASASGLFDSLSALIPTAADPAAQGGDPNTTTTGVQWGGSDISSLPQDHPTSKAHIPAQSGYLSVEMHLPTSPNYNMDVQQHLQLKEVADDPNYAHPYYMDRGNGPSHSTDPGRPGGFAQGNNYLSPQEEQWYMNMRWPYSGEYGGHKISGQTIDMFRHKKIMVYCERTKKGVVCVPGDYGPNGSTGRVAGVSPDVWFALGKPSNNAKNGDKCWFGWLPDDTPLGPIDFTAGTSFQGGALPTVPANLTSTGSAGSNTPPANAGSNAPANAKPKWMTDHPEQMVSTPDPIQFAERWGDRDYDVPVNFEMILQAPGATLANSAAAVYNPGGGKDTGDRSDSAANEIWNEFRNHFKDDDEVKGAWDSFTKGKEPKPTDQDFNNYISSFITMCWTHPFLRGWVVYTADRQVTVSSLVTGDFQAIFGGNNPISDNSNKHNWNFHQAHAAWEHYLKEGPGDASTHKGAIGWMVDNLNAGKNQNGLFGRSLEEIHQKIIDNVSNILGSIWGVAKTAWTGLVNLFRMELLALGHSLSLADYAGRQSNLLNRVFNDSLYFNAGNPGSLLYYADNPFTREYGEPVVEVRQPFQRMHFIDSFQHIISNGIVENFDDVATVVTAVSNGHHPVTVRFDKGAPTDRQVEKSVETGLYFDSPKGLSKIAHPIQNLRSFMTRFNHGDAQTSAKRVALWHLKESLKNIYGGEIILLGDPTIRPHDLIYMSDSYEKMWGMFECEQIIHHFTPEMGFISSVTPNAVISINDPARWEFGSIWDRQNAIKALRTGLRNEYGVKHGDDRLYGAPDAGIPIDDIVNKAEANLKGSSQYTGGVGALVASLGGAHALGTIAGGMAATALITGGSALLAAGTFGAVKMFKWVRDNILDAHGCYIQYLNRNGVPMSAGLAYNHGVAVGQIHGYTLLEGSLRVTLPLNINGQYRITTNDLLQGLGWTPGSIDEARTNVDWFTNQMNAKIYDMTGRLKDNDPSFVPQAFIGHVTGVEDGDTLYVSEQPPPKFNVPATGYSSRGTTLRFAYINAPELFAHGDAGRIINPLLTPKDPAWLGYQAKLYIEKLLFSDFKDLGYDASIAIRILPDAPLDAFGHRMMAVIFHRVPPGTPADKREEVLLQFAQDPLVNWDSYMPDGQPYTLNWEMMMAGYSQLYTKPLQESIPNSGVIAAGG